MLENNEGLNNILQGGEEIDGDEDSEECDNGEDDKFTRLNKATALAEKNPDDIKYHKKPIRNQTIGELLLFLISISLIILHISGILILGTIGLVICGAIVFSALSYFMGTYFGTKYYRLDDHPRIIQLKENKIK